MKQSAVEWLKPQIELMVMDGYKSYPNELEEVFEISKEMEKQQQSYSEQEVLVIIDDLFKQYANSFRVDAKEHFLQFKNK